MASIYNDDQRALLVQRSFELVSSGKLAPNVFVAAITQAAGSGAMDELLGRVAQQWLGEMQMTASQLRVDTPPLPPELEGATPVPTLEVVEPAPTPNREARRAAKRAAPRKKTAAKPSAG